MTSKKDSKKIEEKEEIVNAEENKLDDATASESFDPEPVNKDEAKEEAPAEPNQKVISKKVAITRYLTKQGLGQNAIRQIFDLFDELSKL